ncbi:MAG: cytidylate kinase-like family protein [Verrucomicrobiota bacterium]|jgi:cytidylate kinase
MNAEPRLEKCLTFINCQLRPGSARVTAPVTAKQWRAVTISRQTGSGGHTVAEELAKCLQARGLDDTRPWAVFDRNLVEKVLEDHHLPARMATFMPEDRVSEIGDVLEDLCGLHPPSWTLVEKTAETIRSLAELGNVILIGRGANLVTSTLDYVFHVRLVGSLEKRIEFLQKSRPGSKKAALEFIRQEDRGRGRYVSKYFGRDIDDPLLYHLVINTDLVSHQEAARIIVGAMQPGEAGSD